MDVAKQAAELVVRSRKREDGAFLDAEGKVAELEDLLRGAGVGNVGSKGAGGRGKEKSLFDFGFRKAKAKAPTHGTTATASATAPLDLGSRPNSSSNIATDKPRSPYGSTASQWSTDRAGGFSGKSLKSPLQLIRRSWDLGQRKGQGQGQGQEEEEEGEEEEEEEAGAGGGGGRGAGGGGVGGGGGGGRGRGGGEEEEEEEEEEEGHGDIPPPPPIGSPPAQDSSVQLGGDTASYSDNHTDHAAFNHAYASTTASEYTAGSVDRSESAARDRSGPHHPSDYQLQLQLQLQQDHPASMNRVISPRSNRSSSSNASSDSSSNSRKQKHSNTTVSSNGYKGNNNNANRSVTELAETGDSDAGVANALRGVLRGLNESSVSKLDLDDLRRLVSLGEIVVGSEYEKIQKAQILSANKEHNVFHEQPRLGRAHGMVESAEQGTDIPLLRRLIHSQGLDIGRYSPDRADRRRSKTKTNISVGASASAESHSFTNFIGGSLPAGSPQQPSHKVRGNMPEEHVPVSVPRRRAPGRMTLKERLVPDIFRPDHMSHPVHPYAQVQHPVAVHAAPATPASSPPPRNPRSTSNTSSASKPGWNKFTKGEGWTKL
mgnify:CR=1 FL=1